jgi:hypothetical protein
MRDLVHKLLLFLFFLNCLSAPKKIELPEEKPIVDKEEFTPTPARVIAKPILNLKESPDLNSKIIDSIPENYIVFATEKTNEKETIAGHEDYWYKAQFKNKTGWLFGKFLNFTDQEIAVSKAIQASLKIPQSHGNFKKLRKYFDANMSQKNYKQILLEFGKSSNEIKFKGSNFHGGFNSFIEVIYPDFRLIFIDQFLFDMTFFNSDKLKNKTIQIGSDIKDLETEFETPFYMSKDQFSYLTCIPRSDECPTGYPNTIHFQLENQKVKSIRLTMYLD